MTDNDLNKIITDTVNMTVLKLKMAGLMKDDRKSAYQKTEELLKNYNIFLKSDQPFTQKLIEKLNESLCSIEDDSYYEIIPMIFFEHRSREEAAEYYDTTVTTISRNKNRLVNRLKKLLFSDDVIFELFLWQNYIRMPFKTSRSDF